MPIFRPLVFFINGVPGSGKDTFFELLKDEEPFVKSISSISCIEKLLGIPSSDKRPEARKVKAEVGYAMETYNQYRSRETAKLAVLHFEDFFEEYQRIKQHMREDEIHSPVLFVHAREDFIIQRITDLLKQDKDFGGTLFIASIVIDRQSVEKLENEYSNEADKEALRITQVAREASEWFKTNIDAYWGYKSRKIISDKVKLFHTQATENLLYIDNNGDLDDLRDVVDNFVTDIQNHVLVKEESVA